MRRGFTLLEVMVALAVLGLNLGVIVAGQSIAFSKANTAKDMVGAVGVARAKIFDIEQKLMVDGFGDFDKEEEEDCSRDLPMYRCEWTLKRIELPVGQMLEAAAAKAGDIQKVAAEALADEARRSGGPTPTAAGQSVVAMLASFKGPIQMIQERIEDGLRELRLTVKWKQAKDSPEWESFTVVTHLVDFKVMGVAPAATGATGAPGVTAIPGASVSVPGAAAVPSAMPGRIGSVGAPR